MNGRRRLVRSSRKEKIAFLRAHSELWDVPWIALRNALVEAGLVAKSTYILDIGLSQLVEEARKPEAMTT